MKKKPRQPRRPALANPGEVWLWQSDLRPEFYIIRELRRTGHGQMYEGIDVATKMKQECFMSYDPFNGWERIA